MSEKHGLHFIMRNMVSMYGIVRKVSVRQQEQKKKWLKLI